MVISHRVVEIYGAIQYLFIPNADVLKVRVFLLES
jgi:hypothetical protein